VEFEVSLLRKVFPKHCAFQMWYSSKELKAVQGFPRGTLWSDCEDERKGQDKLVELQLVGGHSGLLEPQCLLLLYIATESTNFVLFLR